MTTKVLVALAATLFIGAIPAFAQTATSSSSTTFTPQGAVQLFGAKSVLDTGGALQTSFTLQNTDSVSHDVVYGLSFNKKPAVAGTPTSPEYSTARGATVDLAPLTTQALSFSVPAPSFLSGDYDLYVVVADAVSGRMVSTQYAGTVTFKKQSTYSLSSCSLGAKSLDGKTALTLASDQKSLGDIQCTVSRGGKEDPAHPLSLVASLTLNGYLGNESVQKQDDFSFGSATQVSRTIKMGDMPAPGLYVLTVSLEDGGIPVALPVSETVFIDGAFAQINALDVSKNADGTGAVVMVQASAMNLKGASVSVQLKDGEKVCGEATAPWTPGAMQIPVTFTGGCEGQTLVANIVGSDGVVLATRSLAWNEPSGALSKSTMVWISILALLAALAAGTYLRSRAKNKMAIPAAGALVLIFGMTVFAFPQLTSAWSESWVWGYGFFGGCYYQIETTAPEVDGSGSLSFNKTSYAPGETVTATASLWIQVYPVKGINNGELQFDFNVPGAWSGSAIDQTEGSGVSSFSNTYTFTAPTTPGTYTASYPNPQFRALPVPNNPNNISCGQGWYHSYSSSSGPSFMVVSATPPTVNVWFSTQ